MSFMSFEYARQAADAALQFHQNQGQNIKAVQDDVKTVGTANAQRKDELMRSKIEAEYEAKSADIKKEKAEKMMQLKKDRMDRAKDAATLVLIGTLGGGMLDGITGLMNNDERQMSDDSQMAPMKDGQIDKYATSFKIAKGGGNSEAGAVVSYNPSQKQFSIMGVNTTTGRVDGFQNVSQTEMARNILDAAPEGSPIRGMVEEGPPPAFKADLLDPQTGEMKEELRSELFGEGGFFAQGSRGVGGDPNQTGSDAGEQMAAGLLNRPTHIKQAYKQSAESALGLLRNEKIQKGLNIDDKVANNTEKIFKEENVLNKFGEGAKDAFQKVLFKPLGTSLNQFMAMHSVAKQYEEEYKDAIVEYQAAKKQAAAALQKLQKLEALLAAGSSASPA